MGNGRRLRLHSGQLAVVEREVERVSYGADATPTIWMAEDLL
jgi:hypothetical protein